MVVLILKIFNNKSHEGLWMIRNQNEHGPCEELPQVFCWLSLGVRLSRVPREGPGKQEQWESNQEV